MNPSRLVYVGALAAHTPLYAPADKPSVAAKPLLRPPPTPKRCSVTCAGLLVVAVARGRSCLATTRHSLSVVCFQLRQNCVSPTLPAYDLTTATAPAADLLHSTTHLAGLEPRACSDGSGLRPCALLSAGLLSAPAPSVRHLPVQKVARELRPLTQGYRTPLHSWAHGCRGVRHWARAFITSTGVFLRPWGAWRRAHLPPPPLAALRPCPSALALPIGRANRPAPPCGTLPIGRV